MRGDSSFLLILPIPRQPLRIGSECCHIANKIRACCQSRPEKGRGWPGWGPSTLAQEGLEQTTAAAIWKQSVWLEVGPFMNRLQGVELKGLLEG